MSSPPDEAASKSSIISDCMAPMPGRWSTETIRYAGLAGGGVPAFPLYLVADDGALVCWDTRGEVRTVIPSGRVAQTHITGTISFTTKSQESL